MAIDYPTFNKYIQNVLQLRLILDGVKAIN